MSLSCAMVDSVLESLAGMRVSRVVSITVSAGELSGVAHDALRFSFPLAAAGTILEGVELKIETEAVTVYCPACESIGPPVSLQKFRCVQCGRPTAHLRSGEHLLLQSIELETPDP